MKPELKTLVYYGGLPPFPGFHRTQHKVFFSFEEKEGYFIYRLVSTGLFQKGVTVKRYRMHIHSIKSFSIKDPKEGVLEVEYWVYPRDIPARVSFSIVGRDEEDRAKNAKQVYNFVQSILTGQQKYIDEEKKMEELRYKFDEKAGFEVSWLMNNLADRFEAYYGEEAFYFYLHDNRMIFLPSDMEQISWWGAVPTKGELKLLSKLIVPFDDVEYVLCFESKEDYEKFLEKADRAQLNLKHHYASYPKKGEVIAYFVMKKDSPIPSFAITTEENEQEKEGFLQNLDDLKELIRHQTYEAYLYVHDDDPDFEVQTLFLHRHMPVVPAEDD